MVLSLSWCTHPLSELALDKHKPFFDFGSDGDEKKDEGKNKIWSYQNPNFVFLDSSSFTKTTSEEFTVTTKFHSSGSFSEEDEDSSNPEDVDGSSRSGFSRSFFCFSENITFWRNF